MTICNYAEEFYVPDPATYHVKYTSFDKRLIALYECTLWEMSVEIHLHDGKNRAFCLTKKKDLLIILHELG